MVLSRPLFALIGPLFERERFREVHWDFVSCAGHSLGLGQVSVALFAFFLWYHGWTPLVLASNGDVVFQRFDDILVRLLGVDQVRDTRLQLVNVLTVEYRRHIGILARICCEIQARAGLTHIGLWRLLDWNLRFRSHLA